MGRRKESGDVLNLDSLLDCLTNVVGFLIIVLVLMSLGAGAAVRRIRQANPEAFGIRVEDLARLEEQTEQQQTTLEELRQQQQDQQEQLKKEQAELKQEIPPDLVVPPDMSLEEAKRLLEEERKRLEELQAKFTKRDEELARLKAQLENTPLPSAPPSTVVTIPDPRPAPPNAEPFFFLCYEDRILPIDITALKQKAIRSITGMKLMLRYQPPRGAPPKKTSGGKDSTQDEYDGPKVENYFLKNNIGDKFVRLKVKTDPNSNDAKLVIEPKPRAGESSTSIRRTTSAYQIAAKRTKLQNDYVRYLVSPDSYPVYLSAREVANKIKLPAGWELVEGEPPTYTIPLPEIRIHRITEPPPPKPKPKPKPKPPGPPPPPKPRELRPPLEDTAVD